MSRTYCGPVTSLGIPCSIPAQAMQLYSGPAQLLTLSPFSVLGVTWPILLCREVQTPIRFASCWLMPASVDIGVDSRVGGTAVCCARSSDKHTNPLLEKKVSSKPQEKAFNLRGPARAGLTRSRD